MPARPPKVFLDANVVIRAGKPPASPIIPRIVELVASGDIRVVTTDLTKLEIAKKHATNDFEVISHIARERFRQLAEELVGVKLPETTVDKLRQQLLEKYVLVTEEMFDAMKAETLSVNNVRAMDVFDSYSRHTGIFSGEAKKDQFPDAFIFEVLSANATKDDPLVIVTDDMDFVAVIKDTPHVTRIKSIRALLDKLGFAIAAGQYVLEFFASHQDELASKVNYELNQWGLQVYDIDDAEIDEQTVNGVTVEDFDTFATAANDEILVVGKLEMSVNVSYNHPDWGSATYDNEDQVLVPHHHVSAEADIKIDADFAMTLEIGPEGTPVKIKDFGFDDDKFVWVHLTPSEYD